MKSLKNRTWVFVSFHFVSLFLNAGGYGALWVICIWKGWSSRAPWQQLPDICNLHRATENMTAIQTLLIKLCRQVQTAKLQHNNVWQERQKKSDTSTQSICIVYLRNRLERNSIPGYGFYGSFNSNDCISNKFPKLCILWIFYLD